MGHAEWRPLVKRYSYVERDYALGQMILTLRTTIGLTQAGLADQLSVSRRAVAEWEAGSSYPKAARLKLLIELGVQQQAFLAGREEEEIRALWRAAHQKVLLDERWLQELVGPPGPVQLFPQAEALVAHCAGYLRYPFKKSKRHVPKLSASPLALPSQRDACAIKLRADKPLLNEHASRCLDNQVEGCWVLFVCGKKTQQRIHKHIISLRQPSSHLRSSFLHSEIIPTPTKKLTRPCILLLRMCSRNTQINRDFRERSIGEHC